LLLLLLLLLLMMMMMMMLTVRCTFRSVYTQQTQTHIIRSGLEAA
jgi:hypothetical protein